MTSNQYCNTTSCPCLGFGKILQVQFKIHGTQDIMMIFSFATPFKPGLHRCLIGSMLEGAAKISKNGLATEVKIGGDAEKLAITLIC